jgi:hypothetical protein
MSLRIQADELTKTSWRIIAVELHHAMPRRKPELPHLYVGLTKVSLDERLADLKAGAGPKELAGMHMQLCQDLLETAEDFSYAKSAKSALKREKNRLARLGYALNGISTIWHTYVVDLDPTGMTEVGKGYVYVGQTSHTPEERYSIHKAPRPEAPAKDLRSKVVAKRGLGLNYELMKKLSTSGPVYTREDALTLEKKWAKKLHNMGYRVEAGDATPNRKPNPATR